MRYPESCLQHRVRIIDRPVCRRSPTAIAWAMKVVQASAHGHGCGSSGRVLPSQCSAGGRRSRIWVDRKLSQLRLRQSNDWRHGGDSPRPYGTRKRDQAAFPGLRYAPFGAILVGSLREQTPILSGPGGRTWQLYQHESPVRFHGAAAPPSLRRIAYNGRYPGRGGLPCSPRL
jgi:hypothetical protein